MLANPNPLSTKLTLVMACLLGVNLYLAAEDVKPIPTESNQDQIRNSMQVKMHHSHNILHGLVTKDFDEIEDSAKQLKRVSLEAPQQVDGDEVDNDLYAHFKLDFLRLTTKLEQMAHAKNLDGAAFAYQNLTANCLACHSYLSDQDN